MCSIYMHIYMHIYIYTHRDHILEKQAEVLRFFRRLQKLSEEQFFHRLQL